VCGFQAEDSGESVTKYCKLWLGFVILITTTFNVHASGRDVALERQIVSALSPFATEHHLVLLGDEPGEDNTALHLRFVTTPHCTANACLGIDIYYKKEPCGPDWSDSGYDQTSRWSEYEMKSKGVCYQMTTSFQKHDTEEIATGLKNLGTPSSTSSSNPPAADKDNAWYIVDTQHNSCGREADMIRLMTDRPNIDTPQKWAIMMTAQGRSQTVIDSQNNKNIKLVRDNGNLSFMAFARGKLLCQIALATLRAQE
jgi:hypothetical protein